MGTLNQTDLRQFHGGDTRYRHALMRQIVYTEGARFVAEQGGAYWLLDKVATLQLEPKVRREEFQVWKLRRPTDPQTGAIVGDGATLSCEDGNDNVVWREELDFTDFPLAEIDLYFCNGTIHLPSEY